MFIPRTRFSFPSRAPTWYIGHMHRGIRRIQETLSSVDIVLEVRDARLPLTSINPEFERLLGEDRGLLPKNGKKRLVVYNKRDLAEHFLERPIQRAMLQHAGQLCLFTDTASDRDVKHLLQTAIKFAHPGFPLEATTRMEEVRMLICGMPNVGKSSLLNALRRVGVRRGKAAQTGADAGVTRKVTGVVKVWEDPSTYVYDTPGVMVPYFGEGDEAAEKGLKLALTSGLKESLYDPITLADYLLFRLNLRYFNPLFPNLTCDLPLYLQPIADNLPTDDVFQLLQVIGRRIGALRAGGIVDEEQAAKHFIQAFREGKLGLWALDDMGLLNRSRDSTIAAIPAPAAGLALPEETGQLQPPVRTCPTSTELLDQSESGDVSSQPFGADKERPIVDGQNVQSTTSALEEPLFLLQPGSSTGDQLDLIPATSPTSMQISSYIGSFINEQRKAMTELSNSKTQIKKRERAAEAAKRKEKWQRKHPHLVKSDAVQGRVGGGRRGQRVFFVGGDKTRRKIEKKRYLARKVTKRRAKMR